MKRGRDNSKRISAFQQELTKIRRDIKEDEKKREIQKIKNIDYSELSYSELRKVAKDFEIDSYWRKKKQQLIEELTNING
tara:strand:+ start:941 stop:1180 length:240 start_codon:yes stop_codon:yes gene_type:complete